MYFKVQSLSSGLSIGVLIAILVVHNRHQKSHSLDSSPQKKFKKDLEDYKDFQQALLSRDELWWQEFQDITLEQHRFTLQIAQKFLDLGKSPESVQSPSVLNKLLLIEGHVGDVSSLQSELSDALSLLQEEFEVKKVHQKNVDNIIHKKREDIETLEQLAEQQRQRIDELRRENKALNLQVQNFTQQESDKSTINLENESRKQSGFDDQFIVAPSPREELLAQNGRTSIVQETLIIGIPRTRRKKKDSDRTGGDTSKEQEEQIPFSMPLFSEMKEIPPKVKSRWKNNNKKVQSRNRKKLREIL